MTDELLPLLTLFSRLQEAGLPLGLGEYQLALKALQFGFGLSDRKALARLCRTLWIKTEEERLIFDYHFERLIEQSAEVAKAKVLQARITEAQYLAQRTSQYAIRGAIASVLISTVLLVLLYFNRPEIVEPVLPRPAIPSTPADTPVPQPDLDLPEPLPEELTGFSVWTLLLVLVVFTSSIFLLRWLLRWLARPIETAPRKAKATPLPLEQVQEIQDEVQLAQVVRQTSKTASERTNPQVIRVGEYFPITSRQLKQGWRYLRRSIREGPRTELDVNATVQQIGQQGMLLDPVFVPAHKNRTELMLLVDQDGSMVPFHGLSQRIAETAVRAGRLGKAGIYYFHNCPDRYLYHDSVFQAAEAVDDFIRALSPRTVVLIFSDGGAARGGFNRRRVELTINFLGLLDQQVSRIAWLNPLPHNRWQGTTAETIAQVVPMFEVSRQDFQNAIDVLRGRWRSEIHDVKSVL